MKRFHALVVAAGMLCVLFVGCLAANGPGLAFGGGGPAFGIFRPGLSEINSFVEGAGFASFEGDLLLVGGGGRGGVAPGPVFGGAGWGAWITSRRGDFRAEYSVGAGGFDAGYAVGGSPRSVLTVGLLLGGGAAEVVLTEPAPVLPNGVSPRAIIVEPTVQTYDSVFAFVAPYVDMQIQLMDWMGVGVRAGFAVAPFEINWHDDGPLDAPLLAPSGLFVHVTVVFGGIASLGGDALGGN
jgi:hypothetical protein